MTYTSGHDKSMIILQNNAEVHHSTISIILKLQLENISVEWFPMQCPTYGRMRYHFHFLAKMACKGNWFGILSSYLHISFTPLQQIVLLICSILYFYVDSRVGAGNQQYHVKLIQRHLATHTRIQISLSCSIIRFANACHLLNCALLC